jgi:hypothetical protein
MGEVVKSWMKEPLGKLIARKLSGWWRTPLTYPWPEELNEEVRQADSFHVCHHCFSPQEHHGWFCPECGAATGPYNNCMPYIYIFSTGEVLRAGVDERIRRSSYANRFYIFYALAELGVFVPIYWFRMHRSRKRRLAAEQLVDDAGNKG